MTLLELEERIASLRKQGLVSDDTFVTYGSQNSPIIGGAVAESDKMRGPKVSILNLAPITLAGMPGGW